MGSLQFLPATIQQLGCLILVHLQLRKKLVRTSQTSTYILISSGELVDSQLLRKDRYLIISLLSCCISHLQCLYNFPSRDVEASIQRFGIPPEGSEPLKFSSTFSQNSISQFQICLWKQNLVYYRSPAYNTVRIFFTTMSALIIGTVFWDVGSKR